MSQIQLPAASIELERTHQGLGKLGRASLQLPNSAKQGGLYSALSLHCQWRAAEPGDKCSAYMQTPWHHLQASLCLQFKAQSELQFASIPAGHTEPLDSHPYNFESDFAICQD